MLLESMTPARDSSDVLKLIREDYERLTGRQGGVIGITVRFINDAGFRAVVLYRLARAATVRKHRVRAKIYEHLMFHLSQTSISPHAAIGPGFTIRHVGGIVIGARASIGRNFEIRQGVTIGGNKGKERDGRTQPTIGDNVRVAAGAKILGPCVVGNSAMVGANAVVISDVPDQGVAVGIPAVTVRIAGRVVPVLEREGSVEEVLAHLVARVTELEKQVAAIRPPEDAQQNEML